MPIAGYAKALDDDDRAEIKALAMKIVRVLDEADIAIVAPYTPQALLTIAFGLMHAAGVTQDQARIVTEDQIKSLPRSQ